MNRHEVGRTTAKDSILPVPDALRSFWHYTYGAYKFHSGLTNADGNHHPWESKPWTWPMSLRPVLYAIDNQNVPGCGDPILREGRDAGTHACDVVHRGAGAGMGVVADVRQARLALRRDPGGLQRRFLTVVRRHRPADVLLLRGDDGAVPRADHRDDPRRYPVQTEPELSSEERSG